MQGTGGGMQDMKVAYKKDRRHAGNVGHAGNNGGSREQGMHTVRR